MEHKFKIGDKVRHIKEDTIYEITELPGYYKSYPEYYRGLDHSDGRYGMFEECKCELVSAEVNKKDGTPLTWPIGEELIGRKVRFDGYVTGDHSRWGYVSGEEYLIGNKYGIIGPVNISGSAPSRKFGNDFKFTLLPDTEVTTEQLPAHEDVMEHNKEFAVTHIQSLLTSNLAGEISVYITADTVRVYWKSFEFEVDDEVSLEKIIETIIILEGQLVNE